MTGPDHCDQCDYIIQISMYSYVFQIFKTHLMYQRYWVQKKTDMLTTLQLFLVPF